MRASVEFSDHLSAERRKEPGDGLVSGLIAAHDEADRLTEQEIISTAVLLLLLNAGHGSRGDRSPAGGALLRSPGRLAALRRGSVIRTRHKPPVADAGVTHLSVLRASTQRRVSSLVRYECVWIQGSNMSSWSSTQGSKRSLAIRYVPVWP